MAKRTRDIGASVRSRLLNLAREKGQPFDLVITRNTLERVLYRLSLSAYRDRFSLKGALLITTWFADPHRPTRDLDLLGFGDSAEESILSVFREVCGMPADDGITFEVDNLHIERIGEELEYGGLRLRTIANLSRARINVVIDIGFGDAVEPGLEENRVSGPTRISGATIVGLSARDGDCREISGNGASRTREQPHERLLRRVGSVEGLRLRSPRQSDCRNLRTQANCDTE
jgi:hypothetical protein